MKHTEDQTEQQIYIALINKRTNFVVNGIEFEKEKIISGTQKQRERKCRARAKQLAEVLKDVQ
jgi:hypothetical protein